MEAYAPWWPASKMAPSDAHRLNSCPSHMEPGLALHDPQTRAEMMVCDFQG